MYSQFAKSGTRRLVEVAFEPYEECDRVDSRCFAVLDEVDYVQASIAPLEFADEDLPIPDAIGEFCLRHARSLPRLA